MVNSLCYKITHGKKNPFQVQGPDGCSCRNTKTFTDDVSDCALQLTLKKLSPFGILMWSSKKNTGKETLKYLLNWSYAPLPLRGLFVLQTIWWTRLSQQTSSDILNQIFLGLYGKIWINWVLIFLIHLGLKPHCKNYRSFLLLIIRNEILSFFSL